MERQRIPMKEAARILGRNPATIRWMMETGQAKIGRVEKGRTGKKSFIIFREPFMRYLMMEEKKNG